MKALEVGSPLSTLHPPEEQMQFIHNAFWMAFCTGVALPIAAIWAAAWATSGQASLGRPSRRLVGHQCATAEQGDWLERQLDAPRLVGDVQRSLYSQQRGGGRRRAGNPLGSTIGILKRIRLSEVFDCSDFPDCQGPALHRYSPKTAV